MTAHDDDVQPASPPLWAVVPPAVASVLVRELGPQLRSLETRAWALAANGDAGLARDVVVAVRQLREVARQHAERRGTSPCGSAELPQAGEPRGWSRPQVVAAGLTTGTVAELLGVTDRQVRNLVKSGTSPLSATVAPGGSLVIDELSLDAELDRRRGLNR